MKFLIISAPGFYVQLADVLPPGPRGGPGVQTLHAGSAVETTEGGLTIHIQIGAS